MKASVQHRFGAPQVLSIEDVEVPEIENKQVLIRIHASSITQGDRRLRAADYPGIGAIVGRLMFGIFKPRYPIPGTNFAGQVVAVGTDVTQFSVGDDVFGSCDHSAWAEFLCLSEDAVLATMPLDVSYDIAAAAPYGAATALVFMRDVAKVQPGERVLIVGASGGVGRFAVQLACHYGAHVTAVCSASNAAMVKELGAHDVIDYAKEDYSKNGQKYDVVFETHSGAGFAQAKKALVKTGRFATLYLDIPTLFRIILSSLTRGPKVLSSVVLGNRELICDVAKLLAAKSIWPVIASRFPLANIVDAHVALESRETKGTIVLSMANYPASSDGRQMTEDNQPLAALVASSAAIAEPNIATPMTQQQRLSRFVLVWSVPAVLLSLAFLGVIGLSAYASETAGVIAMHTLGPAIGFIWAAFLGLLLTRLGEPPSKAKAIALPLGCGCGGFIAILFGLTIFFAVIFPAL